ncbi:LysR family transcriptional regulator [Rhodovibrionaceae bacterium A322]
MEVNWNDLRLFLAMARAGRLSLAAKRLAVDATTVSRRLRRLEEALNARLFQRLDGQWILTEAGETCLRHAEKVESATLSLQEAVQQSEQRPAGRVCITAVPTLINNLLMHHVKPLTAAYPDLQIDLKAASHNLEPDRGEADLALRFSRRAAPNLLCRKICQLSYSLYCLKGLEDTDLPWVSYDALYPDLPQAEWIERHRDSREPLQIRVDDAEGLRQATLAGLGKTLLPDYLVRQDPRFHCLSTQPELQRDLWLLLPREHRHLARIEVTVTWLEKVLKRQETAG